MTLCTIPYIATHQQFHILADPLLNVLYLLDLSLSKVLIDRLRDVSSFYTPAVEPKHTQWHSQKVYMTLSNVPADNCNTSGTIAFCNPRYRNI